VVVKQGIVLSTSYDMYFHCEDLPEDLNVKIELDNGVSVQDAVRACLKAFNGMLR
jgi:hypothetical protein